MNAGKTTLLSHMFAIVWPHYRRECAARARSHRQRVCVYRMCGVVNMSSNLLPTYSFLDAARVCAADVVCALEMTIRNLRGGALRHWQYEHGLEQFNWHAFDTCISWAEKSVSNH